MVLGPGQTRIRLDEICTRPARGGGGGGAEGGGQNTCGPDRLGGGEILVKRLVMGATAKRVGGP